MVSVNKELRQVKTSLGASFIMVAIIWLFSLVNTIYIGYLTFNVGVGGSEPNSAQSMLSFVFWANLVGLLIITGFLIYVAWSYLKK